MRSFSSSSAAAGSSTKKKTDWSARMRAMNETLDDRLIHSQQPQGRTEGDHMDDAGSVYSMSSMDRRDTTGLSHTRQLFGHNNTNNNSNHGNTNNNNNNNNNTLAAPSPKRDSVVNMWRKRESSDSMHSITPNTTTQNSHNNNTSAAHTQSAGSSSTGRTSVVDQWRKRSSTSTSTSSASNNNNNSAPEAAPSRAPPAWKTQQQQNKSYTNNPTQQQQAPAQESSPWKTANSSNPSPWKSRAEDNNNNSNQGPAARFTSPGKPSSSTYSSNTNNNTPSWKQKASEPSELTIVPSANSNKATTPQSNHRSSTPSWKQRANTNNNNNSSAPVEQESELTIVPSSPAQSAHQTTNNTTSSSVPSWKKKQYGNDPAAPASYSAPWKQTTAAEQSSEPAQSHAEYMPPWKKKLLANNPKEADTDGAEDGNNTTAIPANHPLPSPKKKSFLPEPTKLNKTRSATPPSWKNRAPEEAPKPRSASVPAWQKRHESTTEESAKDDSPVEQPQQPEAFVPAWKKKLKNASSSTTPAQSNPPSSSTPSWIKKSAPDNSETEQESELTIVPSPQVTPSWKQKKTIDTESDLKIVPSPKVVKKEPSSSSNDTTPLWKKRSIGSSMDSPSQSTTSELHESVPPPSTTSSLPPTPDRPKSVKDFWAQQGLDKEPLRSVTPRKVVPAESLQEKPKETPAGKLSVLDKWMRKQSRGEGDDDDAKSTISAVSRTSRYDQIMALTSTPSTIGRDTPKANKAVVALPIGTPALSFSSSDDEADTTQKPASEFDSGVIPGRAPKNSQPRAAPTPPRKLWGKSNSTVGAALSTQPVVTAPPAVAEDPKSPVPNRNPPSHQSPKRAPPSPSVAARMAQFSKTETTASQLSPKKEAKTFDAQSTAASPSVAARMAQYNRTESSGPISPTKEPTDGHETKSPQPRFTRPASPSIAMRMAQYSETGRQNVNDAPPSPAVESKGFQPVQIASPEGSARPANRWTKPTSTKSSINDLPDLNHPPTQASTPGRKSSVLDRWPAAISQTPLRSRDDKDDRSRSPLPPIHRTSSRFGQSSQKSKATVLQAVDQAADDESVGQASVEEKRTVSRGRVSDRWPLAGNQNEKAAAENSTVVKDTPTKHRAPSRGRVLDRWPAAKTEEISQSVGDEIMPSMGPVGGSVADGRSEAVESPSVVVKKTPKKWPTVKTHEPSPSRGRVADAWLSQRNLSDSQQSRNADFDKNKDNQVSLEKEEAHPANEQHLENDEMSQEKVEKMPNDQTFTVADDDDCPTEPESQEAEGELNHQEYDDGHRDIDQLSDNEIQNNEHESDEPDAPQHQYDEDLNLEQKNSQEMLNSENDQLGDVDPQSDHENGAELGDVDPQSDHENGAEKDFAEGEESLLIHSDEGEDEIESQQLQSSGQKVTGRWSNRFAPASPQLHDETNGFSERASQQDPTDTLAPVSPAVEQETIPSPQIIPTNSPFLAAVDEKSSPNKTAHDFGTDGRMRIVPDEKDEQETPFVGEYVLMLFSSQSLSRDQLAYQQQAKTIFMANNVPVAEIDGALIHNRDKRNELFNISGLWAKYPQFFVVGEKDTLFWGDWDTLQDQNEDGNVVSSLGLRPQIQSETVLADSNDMYESAQEQEPTMGAELLGVPELTPEKSSSIPIGEPQFTIHSNMRDPKVTDSEPVSSTSDPETKEIEAPVDTPSRKTSRLKYLAKRHHVAVSTSTPKNAEEDSQQLKTPVSSALQYKEINKDVKGIVDRSVGSMTSADKSKTQPRTQIQQPKKSAVGSNRSAFSFNMSAHRKFAARKSKNTGDDDLKEKEVPVEPVAVVPDENVPVHMRPSGIKGPSTSNSRIATRRLLTKKKERAQLQSQKVTTPQPEIQAQSSENSDFTESKSLLLMPSEEAPSTTTLSTFNPPEEYIQETETVESGSKPSIHPNPTLGSDFVRNSYSYASASETRGTIPDDHSGLTGFADQATVGSKSDEEHSVGPYSMASSYGGRSYEVRSTTSGFSKSSAISKGSSIANRAERLLKQRRERNEQKVQKSPEEKARAENFTRRVLYGEQSSAPTPVHSNNSHSMSHEREESIAPTQYSNQQVPQNMVAPMHAPAPPSSQVSGTGIMGKASAAILERARLSSRYQKSSRFMGSSLDDQDPPSGMSSLLSGDSGPNQGPEPEYQQMQAHKMEVTASASDDDFNSRNMGSHINGGSYASGSFQHSGVESEMGSNSYASPKQQKTITEEDAESDSHSVDQQQSSSWFGGIFQGERKQKNVQQNESKKNREVKASESEEHVGYNCNNFFNHEDVAIEVEYMEDESEDEDEEAEPNGSAAMCGKMCDANSPTEKSASQRRRSGQ